MTDKKQKNNDDKENENDLEKEIKSSDFDNSLESIHDLIINSKFSNRKVNYFDIAKKIDNKNFNNDLSRYILYSGKTKLNSEIFELENELSDKLKKIVDEKTDNVKEINSLRETIGNLNKKREIQHLLDSVTPEAHKIIEEKKDFRDLFTAEQEINAFVVSVDIRRSTELMLKARSPKLFADFITTLCKDLEHIFKTNYGVVDKFTGDGILAFFPEFFSGEDAGYLALRSAKSANEAFAVRYKEYRTSFTSVLRDVGLGTGIDYGKVHQVRMAGALTIVGQPVVYACRLGGAPAGKIYINQPAFEVINDKYPHTTVILETSIEIKNEGSLICYEANLNNNQTDFKKPSWKD